MSGRSRTLWICSPRFDLPRSFRRHIPAFSDCFCELQDKESTMTEPMKRKTMIVTGASQGIGAGVTKAFIKRGYNVVANSRKITQSGFTPTDRLVLVDGNIGEASTAAKIVTAAMSTFGSIDGVVNNAGIFFTKRFTDYTADDFAMLAETNLQGYIHITQLAVKQM